MSENEQDNLSEEITNRRPLSSSQRTRPMPPELAASDDTPTGSMRTRAMSPMADSSTDHEPVRARDTGAVPVVPPRIQYAPPARQAAPRQLPPKKRQTARERRDSGYYIPLWSLAMMLGVVLCAAFGIVALVIGLGGQAEPGGEPLVVVITAPPAQLAVSDPSILATATLPPLFNQPIPDNLALDGPILPTPISSPTPVRIEVGKTVVVDAPETGLNIRSGPSRTSEIQFIAQDQSRLVVVAGPERSEDGLTWWQLRDPIDSSKTGWGAETYLQVAIE